MCLPFLNSQALELIKEPKETKPQPTPHPTTDETEKESGRKEQGQ